MTTQEAVTILKSAIAEGHGCETEDHNVSRHPEGWLIGQEREVWLLDDKGDEIETLGRVAFHLRRGYASTVQVLRHRELETAWYGGLETCGNELLQQIATRSVEWDVINTPTITRAVSVLLDLDE